MSISNIQVPNNLDLFCGTLTGQLVPSNSEDYNTASTGCVVNASAATIIIAQVTGAPTNLITFEFRWGLGSVTTTANAALNFTAVLPIWAQPAFNKTFYSFVTLNGANVPVYLQIDSVNTQFNLFNAASGGLFPSGQTFNFVTICGSYSLND